MVHFNRDQQVVVLNVKWHCVILALVLLFFFTYMY